MSPQDTKLIIDAHAAVLDALGSQSRNNDLAEIIEETQKIVRKRYPEVDAALLKATLVWLAETGMIRPSLSQLNLSPRCRAVVELFVRRVRDNPADSKGAQELVKAEVAPFTAPEQRIVLLFVRSYVGIHAYWTKKLAKPRKKVSLKVTGISNSSHFYTDLGCLTYEDAKGVLSTLAGLGVASLIMGSTPVSAGVAGIIIGAGAAVASFMAFMDGTCQREIERTPPIDGPSGPDDGGGEGGGNGPIS